MKKDEEDRLRREIEAKKQQEMDQKRMRLEESERKRQEADKAAKVLFLRLFFFVRLEYLRSFVLISSIGIVSEHSRS